MANIGKYHGQYHFHGRLRQRLIPLAGRAGWALTVLLGGGLGTGVYLALCALLRVSEIEMVLDLVRQIVRRLVPARRP